MDNLLIALIDAGNNLLYDKTLIPPSSTHDLLSLLDKIESLLKKVDQYQPPSMRNALNPSKSALVSVKLLTHPDSDVRVSVVSCLTEILRISSPEPPYNDDLLKEIFKLIIESFEKLADAFSPSYKKAESVLDVVSKINLSSIMLDLECYDLILQMFNKFIKIIRPDHPQVVSSSMETIMITIIHETDEISTDLLNFLLATIKKENKTFSLVSWSLVEKVLSRCACKLKPYIIKALESTKTSFDMYSPILSSICQNVSNTSKAQNIVHTKENEEKLDLEHNREVIHPKRINESDKTDSFKKNLVNTKENEEKSDLEHTSDAIHPKRNPSRLARDRTRKINESDETDSLKKNLVHIKESEKKSDLEHTREAIHPLQNLKRLARDRTRRINESDKTDSLKKMPQRKVLSLGKVAAKKTPLNKKTFSTTKIDASLVGKKIKIWWPLDKTFYEGIIDDYDINTKKHRVKYSDDEVIEHLDLDNEFWELIKDQTSVNEIIQINDDDDILQKKKFKKRKSGSKDAVVIQKTREEKDLNMLKEIEDDCNKKQKQSQNKVEEAETKKGKNKLPYLEYSESEEEYPE